MHCTIAILPGSRSSSPSCCFPSNSSMCRAVVGWCRWLRRHWYALTIRYSGIITRWPGRLCLVTIQPMGATMPVGVLRWEYVDPVLPSIHMRWLVHHSHGWRRRYCDAILR
jgi:hypothetical protein